MNGNTNKRRQVGLDESLTGGRTWPTIAPAHNAPTKLLSRNIEHALKILHLAFEAGVLGVPSDSSDEATSVTAGHQNSAKNKQGFEDWRVLERCYSIYDLEKITGYRKSSIYSWLDPQSPRYVPGFPTPFKLADVPMARANKWDADVVDLWMKSQVPKRKGKNE